MPGMKTIASAVENDYQNRTMTIGVTGLCQQSVLKTSHYQVQVPYSQMSQTLQSIHRRGGKVSFVQLMGNPPASRELSAGSEAAAPAPEVEEAPDESSKRKRR